MITVDVQAPGLEQMGKAMNSLADKIANPDAQLMRRLGDACLEDIDKRFMTRGYGTWPSLAPSTIKRKGNDFILIDSGVMFSSVKVGAVLPGSVQVNVPVGGKRHDPNVPGYHQSGTRRMPQRKIIEITPQLLSGLAATVQLWVSDMIKAFRLEV